MRAFFVLKRLVSEEICDRTIFVAMNYNDRKFRPITNSENGEVSEEMIFHYMQVGDILTCEYEGESIRKGLLIGIVDNDGKIDIRYQQVNSKGQLTTGICISTPELLSDGKIRLHEKWRWTSGDKSEGESVLEEI